MLIDSYLKSSDAKEVELTIKMHAPTSTGSVNLGTWAAGLRPGSPCFCCGEELRAIPVRAGRMRPPEEGLRCPHCGAEVAIRKPEQTASTRSEDGPQRLAAA
jgi:hypothetical protein